MMLDTGTVAIPDLPQPLWPRLSLAKWAFYARTIEPYVACGFSDREAWADCFYDDERLWILGRARASKRK